MQIPFIQFGAGGHGKVVLDAARSAGMDVAWIADHNPKSGDVLGVPVLHVHVGGVEFPPEFTFIVAIGDNAIRARIFGELCDQGGQPRTVVHKFAAISPAAALGAGTLVCAGVVVNAGAQVGADCILNTSASVDHDCVVGAHVHLCPGVRLGGLVSVGDGTLVGLALWCCRV